MKKWIWVLVVVVVIVAALWWMGMLNFGGQSQSAAVVTTSSQNLGTTNNAALKNAVAGIDVKLNAVNQSLSSISGTPTKAQIATVASNVSGVVAAINSFNILVQARITNTKTLGGAVPNKQLLDDLVAQASNAGSSASTANNNAATTNSAATIQQSFKQLQNAAKYLSAARSDITSILQVFGAN